ncbi:3-oxoacyl-[acyl-carrier-protein] synthase III C-terminal domain-containing protein [Anaeromicrobium sediminis]|uniref:3-oxoacyl-ACP synthase n=1 Tax=Anaeromicrobium sediminis TaxID=1478221 RepID=A0A267MJK5_9FIRM|nr:3-oxoacyl-[acyl-carrier-protein] synthase III C-terminal domain-containing protein [Anaeromicrobium sediminis]PAB59098.1 hypothetical protein CCE28_11300 [Anaeromicrobium sediminis]
METYVIKPEVGFPELEIYNNEEMMDLLGLRDSRKLKVLFRKGGVSKKFTTFDFNEKKVNEAMTEMCFKSIEKLFKNNNISPQDIDCVITCCNSSDQQVPGLSSRLFSRIDFRKDIHNYPIYGLGCGAFLAAINMSKSLLKDENMKNVLVVCCEAQTNSFMDNIDPNNDGKLIGLTIFGDGAAAALVTKDDSFENNKIHVLDTQVLTHYSDSMTMTNSEVHIDEKLLEKISPHIQKLVTSLLEKHNIDKNEVKHWVMHSGGKKILAGVKKLFDLNDDQMKPSVEIYNTCGNMSCASVPAGLNRLYSLAEEENYIKNSGELGIVLGFGSGFFLGVSLVRYL